MSVWSDRIALMVDGWSTDFRADRSGFSDPGKISIGLWARTWRWQDRTEDVQFHTHAICLPEDIPRELDRISAVLREACFRARAEFTESVPCQTDIKDGKLTLVDNTWANRHFVTALRQPFIPDILRVVPDAPETGAYSAAATAAASVRFCDFSDHLTPYAEPRYARDTSPREWDFEVRHTPRRLNGEIIKGDTHKISSFRTRVIDEVTAAGLVNLSAHSIEHLFGSYAPGGALHGLTENGLPPGYVVYRPQPLPPTVDDEDDLSP